MRIISKKPLREFWERHADVASTLNDWHKAVRQEEWDSPVELLANHPNARIIGNDRAVFNIRGNRYRLVVSVNYQYKIIYIRFIGTHAEYDRINAESV
ncbi:MAG: type II toxin-antitoxin system HigB family toxin [Chloroflexi bacterium]|nr:type II toxin-antitoxin system HigB family toxin [Chloroflexota bacterium]